MTATVPTGAVARRLAELLAASSAIRTGDFELKNGRRSTYFVDFARVAEGGAILDLGRCYAERISEILKFDEFDVVFGPAVKGIPIAIATVIALHVDFGVMKGYAFNRLSPKEHGEKGLFVGHSLHPSTRVLLVDDVITDGRTKQEAIDLLREEAGAQPVGVVVGVNRSEDPNVAARFEKEMRVPLWWIASASDLEGVSGGSGQTV